MKKIPSPTPLQRQNAVSPSTTLPSALFSIELLPFTPPLVLFMLIPGSRFSGLGPQWQVQPHLHHRYWPTCHPPQPDGASLNQGCSYSLKEKIQGWNAHTSLSSFSSYPCQDANGDPHLSGHLHRGGEKNRGWLLWMNGKGVKERFWNLWSPIPGNNFVSLSHHHSPFTGISYPRP